MKKMRFALVTAAAALFTFLATFLASSACFWGWYQPEEPAALREE